MKLYKGMGAGRGGGSASIPSIVVFISLQTGSQVEQGKKGNRQAKQDEHGLGEKKWQGSM